MARHAARPLHAHLKKTEIPMKLHSTLLAASVLLALTACSKPAEPVTETPTPAAETAPVAELSLIHI